MGRLLIFLSALLLVNIGVKGQGLFGPEQVIATEEEDQWNDIYPSDLDGDGDVDILFGYLWDGQLAWYRNDGTGNFGEEIMIDMDVRGIIGIFTDDLDNDEDLDIILFFSQADVGPAKIVWYPNDGNGNFGEKIFISTAIEEPSSVYTADLDGDGDVDLLSSSWEDNKIAWYRNDGNGNFGTQIVISLSAIETQSVSAADLDGDGDLDVLSCSRKTNKINWYCNDGLGNFSEEIFISDSADGTLSVLAADLDGDEDLDVVSNLFNDDKIAWYQNDGSGNFTEALCIDENIEDPLSIYIADLDGDGDMDLLSVSNLYPNEQIVWYENDGNGNFSTQNAIALTGRFTTIYAADIDGDGDLDALSGVYEMRRIAWYENLLGFRANVFEANLPCADTDNGALEVVLSGNPNSLIAPYFYAWSLNGGERQGTGNSDTEEFTISDLLSGSYDLTVSNSQSDTVIITDYVLEDFPDFSENVELIAIPDQAFMEILSNESADLMLGAFDLNEIQWTTTGDGTFGNPNAASTSYIPSPNDVLEESIYLKVQVKNDCGEAEDSILLTIREFACDIPSPSIADTETLYICEGTTNNQTFALAPPEQAEIAWFETATSSNPIAYGAETLFSNAGTYYASAYSVLEGDICFSPRIPLSIEEIILTTSNSGNAGIDFGQVIGISAYASSSVLDAILTVEWTGNNLNNHFTENPTATPYETSAYTATFTDENGCQIATELIVTVEGVEENLVLMPTAFSPNNDGVNDYLQPVQASFIETIRLSIYNRWGKTVFYSEENSPKWNGFHQFVLQEVGTYIYVYEYTRPDIEGIRVLQGNVTLIH